MTYLTAPPAPPAPGDAITFEIYYGVSSPWAVLGAPEAERIARENGLAIHLKPITVVEENGGIRVSRDLRSMCRICIKAESLTVEDPAPGATGIPCA
jgi:hypothetical protein